MVAIKNLQNGLKFFENAKKEVKETSNVDDNWNNLWSEISDKAQDLDDESFVLSDDLEDADADIEDADDMQDYIIERISDYNKGNYNDNSPFITLQNLLIGGSKVKYEDVLYAIDFDNQSNVNEVTKEDMDLVLDDLIDDTKAEIKKQSQKANN